MNVRGVIVVATWAACLCGCAAPRATFFDPVDPELIWPRPPELPRLRFVGELRSSHDVQPRGGLAQAWRELLYGPEEPIRLQSPHAISVNAAGDLVAVADPNAACVHVFDMDRRRHSIIATGAPDGLTLEAPIGVAWVDGTLWIADSKLKTVSLIEDGRFVRLIPRELIGRPAGMATNPVNKYVYISDAEEHAVVVLRGDGSLVTRFGGRGGQWGQFNYPTHVACSADGTVAVSDSLNFRVQLFSPEGESLGGFGRLGDAAGDLSLPKGLAFDEEGNLWVVDAHFENVQAFDPDGRLLMALGGEGRQPGEFWLPAGMTIDGRRRMWIADTYNSRVQVFEILP